MRGLVVSMCTGLGISEARPPASAPDSSEGPDEPQSSPRVSRGPPAAAPQFYICPYFLASLSLLAKIKCSVGASQVPQW